MKVIKVSVNGQNEASVIRGYNVIHDDGLQRNDVQLIMSMFVKMKYVVEKWFTLDVSRLDEGMLN